MNGIWIHSLTKIYSLSTSTKATSMNSLIKICFYFLNCTCSPLYFSKRAPQRVEFVNYEKDRDSEIMQKYKKQGTKIVFFKNKGTFWMSKKFFKLQIEVILILMETLTYHWLTNVLIRVTKESFLIKLINSLLKIMIINQQTLLLTTEE